MMDNLRTMLTTVVVSFLITTSFLMILVMVSETVSAYTVHDPIYIDGDDDFTSENGVTDGSGTPSDPYIIEEWDIEAGSEDGITILNTDVYFVIRDVYVHDATGLFNVTLFMFNVSNGTILDSIFENSKLSGLAVAESHSVVIENNTILGCNTAIWVYYSRNVTISMNAVSDCHYGAYCYHSDNSTVLANTLLNCTESATILEASGNSTVMRNVITNNSCGIQAISSPFVNLTENNISADGAPAEGIATEGCSNGTISLNNISSYHTGISLSESEWMAVTDNHIHNSSYGVWIVASTQVNASDNTIETNHQEGVGLRSSSRCEVMNNDISGGMYGIGTWFSGLPGSWHSSENNISGNRVTGTYIAGIFEVGTSLDSNNNNISMNEVYGNDGDGIYISGNDDILYDNIISNNGGYGVLLVAQRATVIANTFVNDGLYIGQSYSVMPITYFNTHTITDDNTVNGKPLLYFKNQSDLAVAGDSAGQLIIVDCERVDVSGLELSNTDIGIQVVYSDEVDIDNCTVTDVFHSIQILRSENCSLRSNVLTYCTYGLSVRFGNDTTVSNNSMIDNAWGLVLEECQRSTISLNRATANEEWGLSIWSSNQTIVMGNILNENGVGVYLYYCENATVFHNNFLNNTVQGSELACSSCYWNNTYPDGGNYWSDYEGVDQFSGSDQDIPGADDIGDTPYLVIDTQMDNFPLMSPTFTNLPPTAMITVTPTTGAAGLSFSFDASDSYDAEDPASVLEVRWDWDDDGVWDTDWSSEKVEYHQYDVPGEYTIRLEVRDTGGLTNTTIIEVVVVEVIPEFSSLLLPVLSLLLCIMLIAWRRRGKNHGD